MKFNYDKKYGYFTILLNTFGKKQILMKKMWICCNSDNLLLLICILLCEFPIFVGVPRKDDLCITGVSDLQGTLFQ